MYPEDGTDAVSASRIFLKRMKEKPDCWSEALLSAVENLQDSEEQTKFLCWIADPKGKCREQNKNCKPKEVDMGEDFLKGFTITDVQPGKYPTYHIVMNKDVKAPLDTQDEKVSA